MNEDDRPTLRVPVASTTPLAVIDGLIGEKYRIVRRIGAGGMGAVYEARHTGTGRRVAVKVIAGEAGLSAVERFIREARAAAAIDNAHIVEIFDVGHDARWGCPFMVMEYLTGEDLRQLIARLGPLRPSLALRIAAQACVGLTRAHESGIVHRDIKPANIFVARRDAGELTVKVLDFGIAQVNASAGARLTRTGSVLGSPGYMSPEQAIGARELDPRTDVWSLGVVLYEMLTGQAPWHHVRGIGELIAAIATEAPVPVRQRAPWVPAAVAAIVHGALAPRPADRTESTAAMLSALRALLPDGWSLDERALTAMTARERVSFAARLPLSMSRTELGATTLLGGLGGAASHAAVGISDRTAGVDSLLEGLARGAARGEPESVRPVAIPIVGPSEAPGAYAPGVVLRLSSAPPAVRTLASNTASPGRPRRARASRVLAVLALATIAALAAALVVVVAAPRRRAHVSAGAPPPASAMQTTPDAASRD